MGKINMPKVLVGGLIAGLVLNVLDYLAYGVIFAASFPMQPGMKGLLGLPILVWYILMDFLYGLVLVYLYAAIRPRFGAGPRTALIAGLLMWVMIGLLHALSESPMATALGAPRAIYTLGTLIALVVVPIGAVAGAKFYTEA
jgi:hypothetical protein